MSFLLDDDQELIQKTVRELARGAIQKRAVEADLKMRFPRENVQEVAQLGLLGVTTPQEFGGAGADAVTLAIACEELAAGCATTGAFTAVTNAWITDPLAAHGNDTLRETWLPRVLGGEALGTFGLHEDAVGADPFRIRTSARPDEAAEGDEAAAATEVGPAILSGTKDLTFLVGLADLAVIAARRGKGIPERRVDLYAIPTDREGVVWGSDESKLGLRGYPAGPLYLDKVRLDPEDLIGAPGQGPEIMRRAGQLLTIGISACAVGLTRAALEAAIVFANEREQFGSPIARFEAIQHAVADMRIGVSAARGMVLQAAARLDHAGEAPREVEEANAYVFDTAKRLTRTAIRVHGGAGFMRDLPVERYARDVRTLAVVGRGIDVSKSLVGMDQLRLDA